LRGANLHVDEFKQAKCSDSKAIFGKLFCGENKSSVCAGR
jgi:hypothetical protein